MAAEGTGSSRTTAANVIRWRETRRRDPEQGAAEAEAPSAEPPQAERQVGPPERGAAHAERAPRDERRGRGQRDPA